MHIVLRNYISTRIHFMPFSDLEILERQLVPGLAMWPGVLPREAVVGSVTSQLDVVPTLVHFAKGSLVKGRSYDGENIADTLVTRDGYDTPSRYIPQYCGDDLWSITFVAQGGMQWNPIFQSRFQWWMGRGPLVQRYRGRVSNIIPVNRPIVMPNFEILYLY